MDEVTQFERPVVEDRLGVQRARAFDVLFDERAQPFESAEQEQPLQQTQSGNRARREQERQGHSDQGEPGLTAAQEMRAESERREDDRDDQEVPHDRYRISFRRPAL